MEGKKKKIIEKTRKALQSRENFCLLINVIGNYMVKGAAMIVSLLIMPAYMNYFSSDVLLGMWFTATALLNWIMMFDFGIGGGVRNEIIAPLENGDKKKIKEILSTAYISVGMIVVILIILQQFVVEKINWYPLLALQSSDITEPTLKLVIHILVIGVCVRFFCVLVCHILYALQNAVAASFLNLMSNVIILVYMLLVEPTGSENDIVSLAWVQAIATNLPSLIAMIVLFTGRLKGSLPSLQFFNGECAKKILGTGGGMFYLQILITFVFGVKEVFISWFVGPAQVVEYQVYYKLIGVVGGLFALALTPIWSAVTKALVQRKINWIKRLYAKGVQIIGMLSACQILLVVLMPWIVKVWLGENSIKVDLGFSLLFCVYNVLYMLVMMGYQLTCGLGRFRAIVPGLTLAVVLNVVLAYIGCKLYHSWITVIVATTVAVIPCALWVHGDIRKYLDQLK